jgi:hypothetical protein
MISFNRQGVFTPFMFHALPLKKSASSDLRVTCSRNDAKRILPPITLDSILFKAFA